LAFVSLDTDLVKRLATARSQEEFYDSEFMGGGSFGVRVSKGGSKVFFLIYSIAGRRRRMTLGRYPLLSLEDARARAYEIIRQVAEGRDPSAELRTFRAAETFEDVVSTFFKRHGEINLSPATMREYRRLAERELMPIWRSRKIESITKAEIIELIDRLAIDRQRMVLAKRVRAFLSKLFNFAVSKGIVPANPVSETESPEVPPRQERLLSLDEIKRLWRVLEEEQSPGADAFKIVLLTAQSPASVLKMRWSEVRLDVWTPVKRSLEGASADARVIPLPERAQQILRIRQRSSLGPAVFPSRDQTKPMAYVRKAAQRYQKRMLAQSPWSPRDLPRSVAFHLRELGIRPDVIERLQGRRSAFLRMKSDMRKYDYTAEIRQALDLWNRKLNELLEPTPPPSPFKPPTEGRSSDNKVVDIFSRRKLIRGRFKR
jgi:site-specific recombinase XerD